jgi:hypothetical protein
MTTKDTKDHKGFVYFVSSYVPFVVIFRAAF